MGRDYHVTGGHEAEAEAARRARKPSRLGVFALRLLGFRGTVRQKGSRGVASPQHQHRHRPDTT
jgi:hypothetical protein